MDEAALHELLSGRRHDVGARLLRAALSVASVGYAAAMIGRNFAYDRKWFTTRQVAVPVISLGNITTGGTGKTPMAAWLANWLIAEGYRPGLLSRGYRALANDASPATGNDEKLVLDRLCPAVPHLQQRDRVSAAQRLIDEFHCDVLILDDGFQHRRLHRDLDLVLIDALQPWGFGRVLPRGLLREPMFGLRRGSLMLLTRADQADDETKDRIQSKLREVRGTADCVQVAFSPQRLIGLDGIVRSLESISAQKALAFCGIGNPAGFEKTLQAMKVSYELRPFPDHYHYQAADLLDLQQAAKAGSADLVLTTLKDLVKIPVDTWQGPPLHAVEIGVNFLAGEHLLTETLRRILNPV